MAWNNKNLHRIFPTVNVYRAGPVRGLVDVSKPERDLVAVWTGYFKDDNHSEVELLPILRTVLEGVFGTKPALQK
jgi:hypothetical protein